MKTTIDFELHNRHSEALMREFVTQTVEALANSGVADKTQQKKLASNVLFRICTILDGSAHAGTLDGKAVSPFLGFYIASDLDNVLIADDGSATHEYIQDLIEEHFSERKKKKFSR